MSETKIFKPMYPLTGNGFFYGRIGSGKSWKLKTIAEYYYEKAYKIWDMFGGKRGEGPFWCFPSDEMKLWAEFEQEVGLMKDMGPKEYNVLLVYPYFKKELPNKLPEFLPRITSQLMTIYFKDITIEDISFIIGEVSGNAEYIWNYIVNILPDNATGKDILDLFEKDKNVKSYKNYQIYKNFIEPLATQGILAGKDCKFNLDIKEIAKNKEEIFVLCNDYIPEKFNFLIMSVILRKLSSLVKGDKIHKKNITMYREMSEFMKVVDAKTQDESRTKNFRNFITNLARYARDGLFIFGDTQSPNEVKGMIEGSEDLLVISEMPSQKDREIICDPLKRDDRIHPKQVAHISTLMPWEMVVVERGDAKAIKVKRVQPPRTMCWKQECGNFETNWKNKYNKYKDIKEDKKYIDNLYNESHIEFVEEYEISEENYEKENQIEEIKIKNEKEVKNDEEKKEIQEEVEEKIKEDNKNIIKPKIINNINKNEVNKPVKTIKTKDEIEDEKYNKLKEKINEKWLK